MACMQLKYPCISEKKRTNRSLRICNLKVIEGQARVCINSSFLGYFDGLEKYTFKELRENLHHRFFYFSQINSLDTFIWLYQVVV